MALRYILVLSIFLPLAAQAQDTAAATGPEPGATVPAALPAIGPFPAADVTIEQFLWDRRPIVIFADTPNDPLFRRQMGWVEADIAALDERDVVVIVDTAPDARSPVRQRLRPRGFSLVLMDKDGEVKMRKPQPQTVREISRTIDRFPLRRQEMLERRPSGR
jgi:hypothetical protein